MLITSDIQTALENTVNLVSTVLDDDVEKLSIKNQEKLEGILEDLLDIIQDLDLSIEDEYPVSTDVNQMIMEIIEMEEETL